MKKINQCMTEHMVKVWLSSLDKAEAHIRTSEQYVVQYAIAEFGPGTAVHIDRKTRLVSVENAFTNVKKVFGDNVIQMPKRVKAPAFTPGPSAA